MIKILTIWKKARARSHVLWKLVEDSAAESIHGATEFALDKDKNEFRDYTSNNSLHDRVRRTYYQMHSFQNVAFVRQQTEQWCRFSRGEFTILEALDLVNQLVDESDPDLDLPNSVHAFQTAERIREIYPDNGWFQLTGLIHDLGKLMAVWSEPQWSVVGDTFPVGCAHSDKIVFGVESFAQNDDRVHPVYSTKFGMYSEHCGLRNVCMSWGHDEYLYRVLKNHSQCTLPEESLYMIRYHSFYPWHNCEEYMHLCDEHDLSMLPWVQEFNKFDLYSKAHSTPDVTSLLPYYQQLIDRYVPGKLKW